MKTYLFLATLIIPLLGFSLHNHKTEFKVFGDCGMCKSRIETSAKNVDGVNTATWNSENKMLAIEYESDKVNLDDLHKKIAEAGHDTEKARAKDEVYQKLPACCHYERPAGDKTGQAAKSGGSCCSR